MIFAHGIHALHYTEKARLLRDNIREVYAEGKAIGFYLKIMRQVIRLKRVEKAGREQQETLLDLYRRAIAWTAKPTPLSGKPYLEPRPPRRRNAHPFDPDPILLAALRERGPAVCNAVTRFGGLISFHRQVHTKHK